MVRMLERRMEGLSDVVCNHWGDLYVWEGNLDGVT